MPGSRGGGANLVMNLGCACVCYTTLGSGSSASACSTTTASPLHTVTTTSSWHVCSRNEVSDTRIARVGWLRRFVGLADMMICGRDSNTSSALGNAIIANAKCQLLARPCSRLVSLVLAPNGRRLRYNNCCGTRLAYANLVECKDKPCLTHPCAGSTL